ncbi:efflux RND transporter periplasmic adaptor subunit [Erythrobacter sp. F6033]|uniref:efflux RND transporter periplasmic adaptor subunit n=1 Tax=Erythrobacter sp. F6033 TaxID=2926401 RepID=UPI001FF0E317|nr:efflux RND transporter periplasmic adaptor subunit [Erythrobacter sp. F6033]MCK0129258.1 efflux RND transporter periplasmic adaptor subunit [Erythrobacter sp. F6033]
MTDIDDATAEVPQDQSDKKKLLIGGGVLAAAAMVAGIVYANSGDTNWSEDQSVSAADAEAGAGEDIAAAPEPEPEPVLDARGVIAAKNTSTIASRMTARITAMPFREGRSFRRGALLARFDCSTIQAELRAARAATVAYKKSYETNVELDSYEAVGRNEVAISQANLGRAQAEANAISAQLKDCSVYAPFAGTVVEEIASRGEVAASGQPLLRIQSGGDLEADLIVPSNWLTWLRPGAAFDFVIDETGATITGEVTRLGASVDPVSKTIRVSANIVPGDAMVLPGMSGTATFEEPEEEPAEDTTEAENDATEIGGDGEAESSGNEPS